MLLKIKNNAFFLKSLTKFMGLFTVYVTRCIKSKCPPLFLSVRFMNTLRYQFVSGAQLRLYRQNFSRGGVQYHLFRTSRFRIQEQFQIVLRRSNIYETSSGQWSGILVFIRKFKYVLIVLRKFSLWFSNPNIFATQWTLDISKYEFYLIK